MNLLIFRQGLLFC